MGAVIRGLILCSLVVVGACDYGIHTGCLATACTDSGITPVAGASIAAGSDATCVLRQDGSIVCWGDGGHLGTGSLTDSSSPVAVPGINDGAEVAVGVSHACAVHKSGEIVCWGTNDYGEIGNGTTSDAWSPAIVPTIPDAIAVSTGDELSCAIRKDATVWCWGHDDSGQVGNGTTANNVPLPTQVMGVTGAVSVAAGYTHACAATSSGAVYCWGGGGYGENGSASNADTPTAALVAGISNAAVVTAGSYYTCALTTDGHVSCWGVNWNGRLGDTTVNNSTNVPTDTGLTGVKVLSSGSGHSCVVKSDGTVACWGENDVGQCGVGAYGSSLQVPVPVSGVTGVSDIAAGDNHTCALLSSGKVMCWGANYHGALGQGTTVVATQPVTVTGESSAAAVACGDDFTCAAHKDGSVSCWGANDNGELGLQTPPITATPAPLAGVTGITAIRSGPDSHTTCALGAAGAVTCWGSNDYGQMGNNNGSPEVPTPFGPNATQLTVGDLHVCVLVTDGTVKCAGYDGSGQIGNGATSNNVTTPTAAIGVTGATWLGGGTSHNCAVVATGVLCWGDDDNGQLGDGNGSGGAVGTPQAATALTFKPSDIQGGADYTCAIDPSGAVWCFGTGGAGQMGSGSLSGSSKPVKVLSLTQAAVQLALGDAHACARMTDGSVSCWGANVFGQLGNGATAPFATAGSVKNISDAAAVCSGTLHSCAVRSGGQVVCWGSNAYGQLGDGTSMISDSPTAVTGF